MTRGRDCKAADSLNRADGRPSELLAQPSGFPKLPARAASAISDRLFLWKFHTTWHRLNFAGITAGIPDRAIASNRTPKEHSPGTLYCRFAFADSNLFPCEVSRCARWLRRTLGGARLMRLCCLRAATSKGHPTVSQNCLHRVARRLRDFREPLRRSLP